MTRRRTASDQVSAALVDAAETVLDREGPAGVTIRAVAREAGVAPMGVYNRFTNKDGLIEVLAIRAFDDLARAIDVPGDQAPVERLLLACDGYRRFALTQPARYSLIFAAGSPAADSTSPVTERGRQVFATLIDMVAAAGFGRLGDPPEAAQVLWNAMHGAVTIELAGINQTADAEASYRHTVEFFIRGVSGP